MRILKNIIVIVFILLSTYLLSKYVDFNPNPVLIIIIVFFYILFFFNIIVRRYIWFQPYFTSKYNILNSKYSNEEEYDFPKSMLFLKVLEVLDKSKFRVLKYDEKKGSILVTTPISWLSWGENIYINIEETDEKVIMKFCSTSLFGIYSWGKHEDNYLALLNNFNESLII